MINDFGVNSIFKYEISRFGNLPELKVYAMSYYKKSFFEHMASSFLGAIRMTYVMNMTNAKYCKLENLIDNFLTLITADSSYANRSFGMTGEIDLINPNEVYDFLKNNNNYEYNQFALSDEDEYDSYNEFKNSLEGIADLKGVEKNILTFTNLYDTLLQGVLQSSWFKSNEYGIVSNDVTSQQVQNIEQMSYIKQYLVSANQSLKVIEKQGERIKKINPELLLGIGHNPEYYFNPAIFNIKQLGQDLWLSRILKLITDLVSHFHEGEGIKINLMDTSNWNSDNFTTLFEYLNNDSRLYLLLSEHSIMLTDYDIITEFIYNSFGNRYTKGNSISLNGEGKFKWINLMHDGKNILKKKIIDGYDFGFIGCFIDFIAIMSIRRNGGFYDSDFGINRSESYKFITSYREKLMKGPSKRYDIGSYFK